MVDINNEVTGLRDLQYGQSDPFQSSFLLNDRTTTPNWTGQTSSGVGNNMWGDFTSSIGIDQDFLGMGDTFSGMSNWGKDTFGPGGTIGALGAGTNIASGLAGTIMGIKNFKEGQKMNDFMRGIIGENMAATKKTTNRSIEKDARNSMALHGSSAPRGYDSLDQYMSKYSV